ncbi:MAG: DUF748 domain-containing protein [Cyclobacteriaceae bacterium]|nr:DUF748 domain-containing protein [Cyclobacteriaceae bacterium]
MARAKKKFFLRKPVKILLIILGILILVRLILPSVVLHYANKTLAGMNGYYGHIEDIDIALIRGAYKIDSIYLNKVDTITQKQTSFFSASEIDLSVEWKALFHGSIVGELIFEKPILKFSKDKVEPKDLRNDSTDFRKLLDDFMPLRVNRFEVNHGQIQYIDQFSSPRVDVTMTDVNVLALNLKNSYDSAVLLPATVQADADIYEGTLDFKLKLNPLADQPTFDMNAELKNTNLVLLNDFFQAYANLDVNKGTFGMYAEVAAKQGAFTGYVKPIVQGLDVYGPEDKKDNIFRKIWEGLAGGASEVLENQPKDQFATKIPFEGRLDDPKANLWVTITNVLQNAFINALQPSIDNDINIGSVEKKKKEKKTLLQKVFGKKDDEEKDARKKARQKRREKKKDE